VKEAEITDILRKNGAWKAPGPELLPTGFLKACKGPLAKLLAELATASLQLEHFPTQFRAAKVVVPYSASQERLLNNNKLLAPTGLSHS
jgi:hypothetical protein